MTVNVITSCSAIGWEKYGKRFVETFEQYWPKSIQLHVVSEDELPRQFLNTEGPKFWSLDDSKSWQTFRDNNAFRLWVHGNSSTPRPPKVAPRWRENSGYNFRFDAYKFSKKVFAIELVTEQLKVGRALWLDADVLTFAPVPESLPELILPLSCAVSCLTRIGYHSECGCVGYNLDHPETAYFIKAFAGLYHTEEVFLLPEWHDSYTLDWLRNKLLTATYAIPHKSKGHPFINSLLGKYMDHLKGRRKDAGRTSKIEQTINHDVDYWR